MAGSRKYGVGVGRRNAELDLGAGFRRSPDDELAAEQLRALAHTMEPEVSRTPLCRQERGVDAFAIIPDPQSKLPLIIAQLDFNQLRLGMSERISTRLARDA